MYNSLSQKAILKLLQNPFDCSEAYADGCLTADGTPTGKKAPSYSKLHRIVYNVKRVMESNLRCTDREFLLVGLCVVNEELSNFRSYSTQEIHEAATTFLRASRMGNDPLEESVEVSRLQSEDGESPGAPVNNTSGNAVPELPITKQISKRKLPPDIEKELELDDSDDTILSR